jgi:hypothetical protein
MKKNSLNKSRGGISIYCYPNHQLESPISDSSNLPKNRTRNDYFTITWVVLESMAYLMYKKKPVRNLHGQIFFGYY